MADKYDETGTFQALLGRMRWSQAGFSEITGISLRTVKRWCREEDNSPGKRIAIKYLEVMVRLVHG